MSTKTLSRAKKLRQKDDIIQEIVPQVHKPTKRDTSSDRDTQRTDYSEESLESNKNYLTEDHNDNYTSSKELSDSDTHKTTYKKDTDLKKDCNKHSHFTDSRPQSLSFYEDEKMPEELSGNLELLSPEEKKHYKRRNDERNIYNSIQDVYGREGDEIISGQFKKSKSRKKKHVECEAGMGDSRELMIPKEKKKSKKKKRENSPVNAAKKKHRKRDEEYETKTEITLALEELQDDVFENNVDEFIRHEKVRKSPRKSDKLYIQKKNKFEVANKTSLLRPNNSEAGDFNKSYDTRPIETALKIQRRWIPFTTFCHGLLGGLAFAHFAYIHCNRNSSDPQYLMHYANYSDIYTCMFYLLGTICLISVFDRYDITSITTIDLKELLKHRKSCAVVILYVSTMLVHLIAAKVDDKMSLVLYNNNTEMTASDISEWYNLSLGRAILAFISWIVISMIPGEDSLSVHLKELA